MLTEFETKKAEKAVLAFLAKRRPPPHIRPQLDIGYRISGQSVELFEIRPRWDRSDEKMEHAVAKATYVKSKEAWNSSGKELT
jgi:hypothetical protein